MAKKENQTEKISPDGITLNKIQQQRLSMLSGVDVKEIAGKNIARLSEELKWKVDPRIFLFKRICGRVVKKDPVTGVEYPVPFATVYVEDTDCNVVTYHPPGSPWSWHFPFFCQREIIATTHTDACGNFCVWVPRFDIDWIRHWRRERICFPIIFRRPILKDLIPKLKWPPVPNPPDPAPWEEQVQIDPSILNTIGGSRGDVLRKEISRIKNAAGFGMADHDSENLTGKRLFEHEMPPPLPADFKKALAGHHVVASNNASAADAIRTEVASRVGMEGNIEELRNFSHLNYIGPFYRCIDFYVPVWQMVKDVPDITFRVTQDTNGDGVEETIYSEGHFDVRWDAGQITNVTLLASSLAKESRACHTPVVPCGNAPDILFAGLMPLRNPLFFNDVTGYALRPNKPRPSGVSTFPASTPFYGTLQLYGCVDLQHAKYYRIKQSDDNGGSYSAITGQSWNNYLLSLPIPITADTNGWYPVEPVNPVTLNPVPRLSLEYSNLLMNWPTPPNEKSLLILELGDGLKNLVSASAPVAIVSDNSMPDITFTKLSWKFKGESETSWRSLAGIDCPMIKRGVTARDIELIFEANVQARHLRDASLYTAGCGGGAFSGIPDPANNAAHFHTSAMDNSVTLYQRYELAAGSLPGCYSFECIAFERSMNPDGHDAGFALNWNYDPAERESSHRVSVAVVNEA